jgi:hypothetical protein
MQQIVLSLLLGMATACTPVVKADEQRKTAPAPTFAAIEHVVSHSMAEDRPDRSCTCLKTGRCTDVTVIPEMGYSERRGEACEWNAAAQTLDCKYEQRFVREMPVFDPTRAKGAPLEMRQTAGHWKTYTIKAKRLKKPDGSTEWCTLPI